LYARYDTANIIINKNVKDFTFENPLSSKGPTKLFAIESSDFTLNQILFLDQFSMAVKEKKANFTNRYFNRIDENVQLSNDGKYLLSTTEIDGEYSSFVPARQTYVDSIVDYYNQQYRYYKRMGFTKVYATVMPNKVSIIAPEFKGKHYNHLADKVMNAPGLEPAFIDIYSLLEKAHEQRQVFLYNDTHWNCAGEQVLVDYINENILADHQPSTNQ
jgi:hypothetical protein